MQIQSYGIWFGTDMGGEWAVGPQGVLLEFMSSAAALAQAAHIRRAHQQQGKFGLSALVRVRSFGSGEFVEG